MKKLLVLFSAVIALSALSVAGCGVKNSNETFEPRPEPQTVTEEDNNSETQEKPDCNDDCRKKMPRVLLRRGHGNAVGFYGGFADGKFFFVRFGDGEGGDFEVFPEPLPVPLPDEIPAD